MYSSGCKVIDIRSYYHRQALRRRRETAYFLLAVVPQYLSLGALVLYGLLRVTLAGHIPFSYYVGPLTLLWPISFFFLLTSYVCDILLWEE